MPNTWGNLKMKRIFLISLCALAMTLATVGNFSSPQPTFGVEKTLYVDVTRGSDDNPGSTTKPLKTIQKALEMVQPGWTIKLESGVFQEEIETVRPGKPQERIVIEPLSNAKPILDGKQKKLSAPRILHSYYTLRGLEIRDVDEGVRLEGVEGVLFESNSIHHVKNECLRLRFSARKNTIKKNIISQCGVGGNGEGIYVGTAPEQREKNQGKPDPSEENVLTENHIYDVTEAIDIKEDSSNNIVSNNRAHHCTDLESGCINSRADHNSFLNNESWASQGAGFRFGGDIAPRALGLPDYHYGSNNILRGNVAYDNVGAGYKFMHGPQDADCSNIGSDNRGGLYYFGSDVEEFLECSVTLKPKTPEPSPPANQAEQIPPTNTNEAPGPEIPNINLPEQTGNLTPQTTDQPTSSPDQSPPLVETKKPPLFENLTTLVSFIGGSLLLAAIVITFIKRQRG